ncbi:NnrU family protein [Luteimonas sp. e5]
MGLFLLGLVVFLGLHSLRMLAPRWRQAQLARLGEKRWKGLFSLISLLAFIAMAWGFAQLGRQPQWLWQPPASLRHAAFALLALAFVLLTAAYVPHNAIRARLRHPMLLGTALWALAHLMLSGKLHMVLLCAGFALWAVLGYAEARRRPLQVDAVNARGSMTLVTIVLGLGFYLLFALYLHRWLFGVAPL